MGFFYVRRLTLDQENIEENIVLIKFVKNTNFILDRDELLAGYSHDFNSIIDPVHTCDFYVIRDGSSKIEIYRNNGETINLIHIA